MCALDENGQAISFYLPWKSDYRGRIYAETPWLTPQGGDLQRALLEFANGRTLNEHGVSALRRHGANLVKRRKILDDFGITDRQVITFAERENWIIQHEKEIIASAKSPLSKPFWREVATKPMQFLAFCLAYRQWCENPNALIHLPVQIDGTCNGLQHIAALTGDMELARAVSVLPKTDNVPGDIYSELAMDAVNTLGQINCGKIRVATIYSEGLKLADAWLASSPKRRAWLNRNTVKKVVMTIPYGASQSAQAISVLEAIVDEFEQQWMEAPPTIEELNSLFTWNLKKKTRRNFVAKCSYDLFEKRRKQAFSEKDKPRRELMRTFSAYVALTIVKHLRNALSLKYSSVDKFTKWLEETAYTCVDLPLLWLSPLGFPVCQDKFEITKTSAKVTIHTFIRDETTGKMIPKKTPIGIDIRLLNDTVDNNKQRDALLPNLIHSLDATHLAMILLKAKNTGINDIGTIHDCLLCHPNDASTLAKIARATFAELYYPDSSNPSWTKPLKQWRDWMELFARLRNLPDMNLVLGALEHPGGYGEKLLIPGSDAKAQEALKMLEILRNLDPSRRFFAHTLLDRLNKSEKLKPLNHEIENWQPIHCLPLNEGNRISDYFFS